MRAEKPAPLTATSHSLADPGWGEAQRFATFLGEDSDPVRVGQLWVPSQFQLSVIDEQYPVEDGPLLVELLFHAKGGEIRLAAVLSSPLEVDDALAVLRQKQPLSEWKRDALMLLAADAATAEVTNGRGWVQGEMTEAERRAVGDAVGVAMRAAHSMPLKRRRNRVTSDHLAEVAQVYREAWAAGEPPTKAVAEHFSTSHSTAARWVGKARGADLLGPPAGPRGGEV